MKMKNVSVAVITFAFVVFSSSCTGSKKETAESHEGHEPMEQAVAAEATATTEVKMFENVDAAVKSQINGFLTDYFALNQSLIEDNQDGAKAAAKKLSETVNKFDMSKLVGEQMDFYHAQLAKLNHGLKGISESGDIEETRTELSTVSEGIYALAKAYHPNEAALYYQFCPMAKNGDGANWLSNTKEIANPYMGQRMLACGKTKETLN
jgi:hypothetical protein